MQNALVNLNGQILAPQDAKVSVFDRSYLYGDSLYEVVRTYGETLFLLDEHLQRLEASARLCRMVLAQDLGLYAEQMRATVKAFRAQKGMERKDCYIRLVVSRGVGRIGFGLKNLLTPTQYTIIVQPLDEYSDEEFSRGFRLRVADRIRNDPRALDPAMKSGNYLNSLLAYLEAASDDFHDALLCNSDGHVTEGTTFNIFYVKRGILATSPLDIGILDGLTRRRVIALAGELGIPVRVTRFPKERLYEADEVIWTSTLKEVFPVTRVDGRAIGKGGPGPVTVRLRKAFLDSIHRKVGAAAA
jgi:branched-chain amino acid aminotransferase